MKKSVLSLAVAAGLTSVMGTAQASMYVNPQGTGEALIFPFYSTQNGNDTLITIANSTMNAKAVKVRILEAENSAEVRDFNLYLSPNDHFSFALTDNNGVAELRTGDESCTVPEIPDQGGFRAIDTTNLLLLDDEGTDFDNTGIERASIGYVEVIEMGQLDPAEDAYDDALHGADGIPDACDELVRRWSVIGGVDQEWLVDATDEMLTEWDGGGLYGFGQIINVADGTAFGYDAVAIDALIDITETPVPSGGALHYEPGDIEPNFTDAAITEAAIVTVEGQSFTNDFGTGGEIFAVNSLFMATEVINDYIVDPIISSTTDWVMTMPTKRPHVNGTTAIPPFSDTWDGQTACEPVGFNFYNREEANPGTPAPGDTPPVFSPSLPPTVTTPDDLQLCYETTVVQFDTDNSALKVDTGSVVVGVGPLIDAAGYDAGWATISFDPATVNTAPANSRVTTPATGGVTQLGLPVTGFAAVTYTNGQLNGGATLANYAVATEHKSSVVTSVVGSP